jgi:hypothetical protein
MIISFKLFENSNYKPVLTSRELVDFIVDNNLRDSNGKLEYEDAKQIAYWGDTWTLQELTDLDKKGLDFIYDRKPKTFGIPAIILHNKENDTYEILDGKHRVGYAKYKHLPIMAYVTEVDF